jgi:hypothetical protein
MLRSLKPWLYPDTLFAATALKRLQTKCLDVLHRTTESVIRTRKLDLLAETRNKGAEQREEHVFGKYFSFGTHLTCGHGAVNPLRRQEDPASQESNSKVIEVIRVQ